MLIFDKIVAVVSILGLVAFLGVVTTFVSEPDLWIITLVVVLIAVLFFWRELRAGGSHFEGNSRSDTKR
ncbi:MAG: hypothetical protein ACE5H8_13480 [Alphaproteobacteria bacterium]